MSELDLTEAITAAAARLYQAEHGATTSVSADAMFAGIAEMAPPVAGYYLDQARYLVEAVAPLIEAAVREQVARDIETELAAAIRSYPDQRTCSPRQEMAYKVSAHIARGGACVANPKGAAVRAETPEVSDAQ